MTGGVVPARGFIREGSASPVATDTNRSRCVGILTGRYQTVLRNSISLLIAVILSV